MAVFFFDHRFILNIEVFSRMFCYKNIPLLRHCDTGRLAEAGVQALADFVKEMGLPKQKMTKIDQNNCNFIISVL